MARRKLWLYFHGNSTAFRIPKRPCFCWVSVICMLYLLTRTDFACSSSCDCFENARTVTCLDMNLSKLPQDIPMWVETLKVSGNNITTLTRGAFATNGTSLHHLATLLLSGNNVQCIEAFAFEGLPNLKTLDLSSNRLLYISDDAFFGLHKLNILSLNTSLSYSVGNQIINTLTFERLSSLTRLELSGNKMSSLPTKLFASQNLKALDLTNNSLKTVEAEIILKWSQHEKIRVYLQFNPLMCDCSLETLYLWLENTTQVPDAGHLRCFGPERLNGTLVLKLKTEDLQCGNADLETVSYVFLGIVLALIGVIFLMVLYLNRKGIKRWLNNIREACRDQMEVYHYRYEHDSDPRLASVAV
ncbi:wnt-activated inhibitory factor 2 [Huso huso]|uniref:Wnt-activated inhibitory factor 2 n=1 Tax=Huso huso TaxID=61971 RepID=A0ABR0ZMS7_HUSHU